ncbi:hypothetical protein HL658_18345 [Azospirillum sp. RWY-5-1]|uniref:Thaumarchaeal output domain-containing protein n=1 Tax=Azospirillum oleiclasticum TaxID=2735135 RepID=A0ABX2TM05_9PROT|nr:hypothetical protein [Azospirillum oleiclasticum]NYZ14514.1 hypothetical protein [Azospirillum oleiclasticum]NYZ24292.1 hypothetical protein [Azospirillum oleiclasticum]
MGSARETEFLVTLGGRRPRERRLALLILVQFRGGQIMPNWAMDRQDGIAYWPTLPERVQELLVGDMEHLAANDYLERLHFDRVHRCPGCGGHLLNIREVCVECGSSNIENLPVLHHFRCGYVAPIGEFESKGRGRSCPKCGHSMRNLGTDHEIVGEQVRCRSCAISFDEPNVEAACFRCGRKTPVDQCVTMDIWGYRLTTLGHAAAKAGRLFEEEDERLFEPGATIYRRSVFLKMLRDDFRINQRYGIPVSVIALRLIYESADVRSAAERTVVEVLLETLRNVDQIGRFDEGVLVVKLPATDRDGAEVVRSRLAAAVDAIAGVDVRASHVVISDDVSVEADIARAISAPK